MILKNKSLRKKMTATFVQFLRRTYVSHSWLDARIRKYFRGTEMRFSDINPFDKYLG